MSAILLPPNPCLLGILLITKYQHEPSIVFHYPPHPGQDDSNLHKYLDVDNGEGNSSSDDSSSSVSDSGEQENPDIKTKDDISPPDIDVDETGSASPEKRGGLRTPQMQPSWNYIFGHNPTFLAKLLCPARSGHKKRFEVSLNDKVFLGRPAFARENGEWRKKERRSEESDNENPTEITDVGIPKPRDITRKTSVQITQELSETSGLDTEVEDPEKAPSQGSSTTEDNSKDAANVTKEKAKYRKTRRKDDLSMFHVVFAMSPPPLEYHLRVDEMYDHVVKKFSRALKWEQARSSFVSLEAMAIARMTNGFGAGKLIGDLPGANCCMMTLTLPGPNPPLAPLYHELLKASILAKAIANVYSSISACRIAHVKLTPSLSLSLQIPMSTSTSVLPSLIQPQLPGLWLTTATSIPIDDDAHVSNSHLASHFTLLLLSDLHSIMADVHSTNSPLTEPLGHYLRVSKPTKSFLQISQSSGIALSDIQFLASHLIYWRRARAIPPLHQRDTYIVSPNADMSKLVSATSSFAKLFPTLPSLPKILNLLSSIPRPYSTLIPSKDHKPAYMEILAWLFRNGWVTQLRTFAWVRVPPHISQGVARKDRERKESENPDGTGHGDNSHSDVPHLSSSPTLSTHSSTHAAVPLSSSSPPASPILMSRPLHPAKGFSAHLSAISARILATQGEEAQAAWDQCVKYFDGKHALETIAVREGWKRKRVGDLISGWESMGVLRRAKHW